jgi:hypothetical protein
MATGTDQNRGFGAISWRVVSIAIASALISAIAMSVLWKQFAFFAFVGVAFYFMGAVRGFPWRSPVRKAFSIGVFIGIVLSTALFYWNLL